MHQFDLLLKSSCAGSLTAACQSGLKLSKEEEALFDDDDLEDEELDELEAKLGSTRVG